jgi:hypothetical protein
VLAELTARALGAVSVDALLADLAEVTRHDRYQASLGIEAAAGYVAAAAATAGLADVRVLRFPADGAVRWWTFRAPVAWTPVSARLRAPAGERPELLVDHAAQPFSVAAYSSPTPPGGLVAPLVAVRPGAPLPELAGAVAVLADAGAELLPQLAAAGARGFLSAATSKDGHPGRIELPLDAALFGFSLAPGDLRRAIGLAEAGAAAEVGIEVDRTAAMPVVTGVLPGARPDAEVWLTAHLCHPRPGADDNASGVAALLGVARALTALRDRGRLDRTVRFVWAPEFVGTAAFLHEQAAGGAGGLPYAVLNLDMVGADQARTGSVFVFERNPDSRPTLLDPLGEHVLGEVFARTAGAGGRWAPSPFLGFSDHALFADPKSPRPAVQLCHPADRVNHSAGDALAMISPVEMLRATATATVLARVLAGDRPGRPELDRVVGDWCRRERAAAERAAGAATAAGWPSRLAGHVTGLTAAMLALLDRPDPLAAPGDPAAAATGSGPVLSGRWPGPLNVRALLTDLPAGTRAAVQELIHADKWCHALLFNLAIRADGTRTRAEAVEHAQLSLRRPVDPAVSEVLLDALLESGWVAEAPPPGVSPRT